MQKRAALPETAPGAELWAEHFSFPCLHTRLWASSSSATGSVPAASLGAPEQTFETAISLESLSCSLNNPSFHWTLSGLDPDPDPSEGPRSDERSPNAGQGFLGAAAAGVFPLTRLEKGF